MAQTKSRLGRARARYRVGFSTPRQCFRRRVVFHAELLPRVDYCHRYLSKTRRGCTASLDFTSRREAGVSYLGRAFPPLFRDRPSASDDPAASTTSFLDFQPPSVMEAWRLGSKWKTFNLRVILKELPAAVCNAHGGRSSAPSVFHAKGVYVEEMRTVVLAKS